MVGSEIPDSNAERDVVELMRQTMREEGEPEFWARLFTRDEESLPLASELNKPEVMERLKILWFAERYGQPWLKDLVHWDLALRVSLKRKGRKEAVHAITGTMEEKARGILRLKRTEG